jgi:protein O-GlcNAc transferase
MATIAEALALAGQHYQAGQFAAAEQICRQILQTDPTQARALHLLGLLAHRAGRWDEAIVRYQDALRLQPGYVEVYNSLGAALAAAGHLDEALPSFQQALALKPDYLEARDNLAAAFRLRANRYRQLGRLEDAEASYRAALRLHPDVAEIHGGLAAVLMERGQFAAATDSLREAVRLRPNLTAAHHDLGYVYQQLGRPDDAEASYRAALGCDPASVQSLNNLGLLLAERGRLAEARAAFEEALRIKPDYTDALNNLGSVCVTEGRTDEAVASYRRLLQLKPDSAEAHANLAIVLGHKGQQLDEALTFCREALRLDPDNADVLSTLGGIFKDMGLVDEGIAALRRAVELKPDSPSIHSNLVYTLHFQEASDAAVLAKEALRWHERHAASLANQVQPHANSPDPGRRLRVGYVSPDFCRHPIGLFLLPLLTAHDRSQVEVFCYSSVATADDMTGFLRAHTEVWREVPGLTDEQLAQAVRQDRIDVLVDLSAHMARNRLLTFARKPAPVQVTYLAYCSTTGLRVMDYRLTDPFLDPPGAAPEYAEESIWLPESYWCYRPVIELAPPGPVPARAAGYTTFACLNNFCKVTPVTLALWQELMQKVPGSRLLLHAHAGSHRERVRQFFAAGGVAAERIDFVGTLMLQEYFALYHRVDVGLDPFPYGGGTTTLDALWMGVPVVSQAGNTAVSRAGRSILSNAGLPELVAPTPEEYVSIATGLAADVARLAELRAGMRPRLQCSPLTDAARFARHIEAAYRKMWHRWCESGGPHGSTG